MITPRTTVPDFTLPLLGGGSWTLSEQTPENFTMVIFYRGLHCPLCQKFLTQVKGLADGLKERGISLLIASSDSEERARQAYDSWKMDGLTFGYDLSIEKARELGLFISTGIGVSSVGVEEPALFSEPGLFMIRPDQTLYFSDIQTMPFLRPDLSGLLPNLDFILSKGYPARGEA